MYRKSATFWLSWWPYLVISLPDPGSLAVENTVRASGLQIFTFAAYWNIAISISKWNLQTFTVTFRDSWINCFYPLTIIICHESQQGNPYLLLRIFVWYNPSAKPTGPVDVTSQGNPSLTVGYQVPESPPVAKKAELQNRQEIRQGVLTSPNGQLIGKSQRSAAYQTIYPADSLQASELCLVFDVSRVRSSNYDIRARTIQQLWDVSISNTASLKLVIFTLFFNAQILYNIPLLNFWIFNREFNKLFAAGILKISEMFLHRATDVAIPNVWTDFTLFPSCSDHLGCNIHANLLCCTMKNWCPYPFAFFSSWLSSTYFFFSSWLCLNAVLSHKFICIPYIVLSQEESLQRNQSQRNTR